jgi:predicted ATPase
VGPLVNSLEALRPNNHKYLEVTIENFGPIKNGTINLRPLTIFIGPNNSGKSYAAILLRSILEIRKRSIQTEDESGVVSKRQSLSGIRLTPVSQLKDELLQNFQTPIFKLSKRTRNSIVRMIFRNAFEMKLSDNLEYAFSTFPETLNRRGSDGMRIKIDTKIGTFELGFSKHKLRLKKWPNVDIPILVRRVGLIDTIARASIQKGFLVAEFSTSMKAEATDKPPVDYIHDFIIENYASYVISEVFPHLERNAYYLPAARSGIIQAHRVITAGFYDLVPSAGLKPIRVPQFSGVVSDFLKLLNNVGMKTGPLSEVEGEYERRIIHGRIITSKRPERPVTYYYGFQDDVIPLHLASSTVSELAPLFVVIRYYLQKGSIIIIEEPEAHLHPGNQLLLARLLARLVNQGVRVIITTHSAFLLEQLSNQVMAGSLQTEEPAKGIIAPDEVLKSEDVSVFAFDSREGFNNTIIHEIPVNMDGIPQDEFLKVYDQLYEETVKLRRLAHDDK